MILQEIFSLISGFNRVHRKDFRTGKTSEKQKKQNKRKQAKNKNLHIIFFGVDVTICMFAEWLHRCLFQDVF